MDENASYPEKTSEELIQYSLDIQFNYAIDGEPLSINDIDSGLHPSAIIPGENSNAVIIIEIDNSDKLILQKFNLGHITHYASRENHYRERMKLLDSLGENVGLLNFRVAVLVMLVKSIWGIPKDKSNVAKKKLIDQRYNYFTKTLESYLQVQSIKRNLENEDYYRELGEGFFKNNGDTILSRVTFEFQSLSSGVVDRVKVSQFGSEINSIGRIILRYFELMEQSSQNIAIDFGLQHYNEESYKLSKNAPHFIFCYKFLTFLEESTNLNRANLGTAYAQNRIYNYLLEAARFKINLRNRTYKYAIEKHIQHYYDTGKILSQS
jgi:hypothetical protein